MDTDLLDERLGLQQRNPSTVDCSTAHNRQSKAPGDPTTTVLFVTDEDLAAVEHTFTVAAQPAGTRPVFSCNSHGHVWPSMTRGRSKPQDRACLHGSVALLDHVAALFLAVDGLGGRFYFADDGTIRTSDEATVLAVLVRRA